MVWTGNLLDKLNLEYDNLSKGQKKIAAYVMQNYDKAAFMTAAVLSKTVGVSESTIVRFAYTMGYDGYPELQKDLQDVIQNKMTTIQRFNLMEGLSFDEIINASFKTDINNLRVTRERNSPQKIESVVDMIAKARNVYIVGSRSSGPLAEFLAYYMTYMMDNVRLVRFDVGDVFSQILNAGEKDTVITISFPRYSSRTLETMQAMKNKGCRMVAITDNENSPPARLADFSLTAKSYMNSFVDSFVAPLSIINVLIILLGLKKKQTLFDNFEQLEEMWKMSNVYAGNATGRRIAEDND